VRRALPVLRESKAGAIVNISSNAARMPFVPFAHYCAAKAALDMHFARARDRSRAEGHPRERRVTGAGDRAGRRRRASSHG